MFFVVAYSIKGLRFKEVPVLDSMTSSLHFVGPLLFALSLFGFPSNFWPYVVAFFAWGMASHAFGAVQDIIPDRQAGIQSIATVFGARVTMRFALALYLFSSVLLLVQGGLSCVVAAVGLLYVFNILPYINISTKQSSTTNVAWKRFLKINYVAGTIITIVLIAQGFFG